MIFTSGSTRGLVTPALLVLIPLVFLARVSEGDNSVHILKASPYSQLVTSSTLKWLPQTSARAEGDNDFVIGGFKFIPRSEEDPTAGDSRLDSKPVFVCRALLNGIYVSGGQVEGEKRCVVSLLGIVHSYERYDLLQNVDQAARITWMHWDKYVQPLDGGIATGETYVARHMVPYEENEPSTVGFTHYIGKYDPKDKLGSITYVKNGVEVSVDSGEVLVEWEPISYELKSVKFNYWKKGVIKRVPRVLGESTLRNDGQNPATVDMAFTYSYNYSLYWGQGHAILKGLPTTISLANGTVLPEIEWGTEKFEHRDNVRAVGMYLEPGTAVKVTLRANYSDMEVPYTAQLVSRYKDGTKLSRPISGVRREESMIDVEPDFGPVYFMGNMSLVPTTTTTTTTTSTTTGETPVFNENGANNRDENDPNAVDINMIEPPGKKGDLGGGMQADDGGPLSLKNKLDEAGQTGGTPGLYSHLYTIVGGILIAISNRT